jgi:hypothetical protein
MRSELLSVGSNAIAWVNARFVEDLSGQSALYRLCRISIPERVPVSTNVPARFRL